MLDQVSSIRRCLDQIDPWMALVEEFPALAELAIQDSDWRQAGGRDVPSREIPSLYRSYVAEWGKFPVAARHY
jgi:hypothetical protein